LNINLKSYSPLLKIGIPLFMGGVSFTIFRSIDSLFVKHFLGNETLGYYNLGYSLAGYVFIIPNSLSVVLFSKFHEIYFSNKNQSNTVIFKKADEIQKVLGFMILPILIGAVYFFCDFVIVKMAPKFIPNLNLIKIMVLGIFPLSLIHVPNQLLITQNKFKYYILVGLGSNIFLISCLFGIRIYFNIGPSLVAIITSISYGVYFIVLYIVVFHKTHKWLLTVVCYILFYAYFVCVAVIISNLNLFENYQLLYRVILNFILFMFSMIPFLFYFESRIKLIKKTLTPYLKKNG
jgi:O-antigen/teichoic acid export membrane protein